jgi:SAM-dependent methyltransferase
MKSLFPLKVIKYLLSTINYKELALGQHFCSLCNTKKTILKLHNSQTAVRCLTCRATAVTMSFVTVLRKIEPDLLDKDIYELSARGPLVQYLRSRCKTLTCSEYFPKIPSGTLHKGILCQDVQKLAFPDNSFDIVTSTEVFEHIPDDLAGFRELHRVLRPGGLFIFTVPLFPQDTTVERAVLDEDNSIQHLLPQQYHGDPIRGHKPILVFRNYGRDITKRLISQGFETAEIHVPEPSSPWDYNCRVITATLLS